MTKPKRWHCTYCGAEEATPLETSCPNCGIVGYRYPKNTSCPTYARSDISLGKMRRNRRERRQ